MKKILLIVIAILLMTVNIYAQEVPAALQVRLILKILSMDNNLERFGGTIKIGVSSESFLSAFQGATDMKVSGKSFSVSMMSSPGDIGNYGVVCVDKNWAGNYGAASQKAAASKALMFVNEESAIEGNLGAITFKVVDGKPKIFINIDTAKKQGSDFPANFLKMAVLVK
ncbi:MAG: YfiR/HmsC family protein [Spirochaetes bacterium]|jgi:hypothetical protein|nr:YfiR/HmsC family protein [Spirochaetota bacterium]